MTDTTTFKSTINVKTLGNPKYLLGKFEMKEGDKQLLGTIIGAANGQVKRQDPKNPGEYWYGVAGVFEAIPADETQSATKGKVLFAPDIIHDEIVRKLEQVGAGGIIKFAFEAYVKAGGTAGFTWEYRFLGEDGSPEENDPLAEQRKLLNRSNVAPKLEDKRKNKEKVVA